ncbi:MAG: methionyl-tRNA formyltransferase [Myxococcota bacterium]|jgi:methionyl-tRNA formyltransferase
MRIIFFGTPEIAVPSLKRLIEGPCDVVAVVSQPDRGRGRGRKLSPSPVSQVAIDADIPLFRPDKVAEIASELAALSPDTGVVVAFGQFIPKKIRVLPSLGYLINAHASLLPKYRGAAPINHAILEGETTTGVSVMRVDREMDAGPVALVREIEIGANENASELTDRLGDLAAEALATALEQIVSNSLVWTEQDHGAATFAGKLEKEMGKLDWSQPAQVLLRKIRAFAPKPGAATSLKGETLRILAGATQSGPVTLPQGSVDIEEEVPMRIATGDGWLVPTQVQRAGGKTMPSDAFLRGRAIEQGTVLGEPSTQESPK